MKSFGPRQHPWRNCYSPLPWSSQVRFFVLEVSRPTSTISTIFPATNATTKRITKAFSSTHKEILSLISTYHSSSTTPLSWLQQPSDATQTPKNNNSITAYLRIVSSAVPLQQCATYSRSFTSPVATLTQAATSSAQDGQPGKFAVSLRLAAQTNLISLARNVSWKNSTGYLH